ncbi:MAG: hypothetical protein WBQ49_16810, partial [Rhodomicrobium sp.]
MTLYVRVCPGCGSERPLEEDICAHQTEPGRQCAFPLFDIHPTPVEQHPPEQPPPEPEPPAPQPPEPDGPRCPNGHAVEPDD